MTKDYITVMSEINDLAKEREILHQAYGACCEVVGNDEFYNLFAKEKIKHSYQVLGACNYIMKHEAIFQNRSQEFLKIAKISCLLHDIGRFKEIKLMYEQPQSHHDHSLYGYETLKRLGISDARILLPIKQHGHLKDALDNDDEYKNIEDRVLRKEVKEIYQLVKDADKIANLYLIRTDKRILKDLFAKDNLHKENNHIISKEVWNSFENRELVVSKNIVSFMDRLLQVICQVFEIYYKPSYQFIYFHNLMEEVYGYMRQYNKDALSQKYIEDVINTHIKQNV